MTAQDAEPTARVGILVQQSTAARTQQHTPVIK
jgi:hypothetical protein